MRAVFLALTTVIALFGVFMVVLGASNLEADYIAIGTLLGRGSHEPRVSTTSIGIVALVAAGALVGASVLTRRSE